VDALAACGADLPEGMLSPVSLISQASKNSYLFASTRSFRLSNKQFTSSEHFWVNNLHPVLKAPFEPSS
jgi:hypothetical protein